ncbi:MULTISPECIES: hypothetical protein [Rhizobium/Agrobacterium group]|uniref:Uncharacterized protein n=1 Tax=Neorhizobium phenanthreniclasticum TaxID=3157917 RepID=A0ABV0M162_9HYPH|nr:MULTISPECIES: hypothetical protein [Rhizobium/Agrobacterium group]MBP1846141.1 hypothetical protein [Neorhizobium petrolearium]
MRIIFVVLIASVLSILAFKYADQSLGNANILAPSTELSSTN